MNKVLYIILFLLLASVRFAYSTTDTEPVSYIVGIVDNSRIIEETKIGKEVRTLVKKFMSIVKKKIAELEEQVILYKKQKRVELNKNSIGMVFDNNTDFNPEMYKNKTDKDKHLMLYSLAQKKSNEISKIVAEVEQEFRSFISKHVCDIAKCRKCTIVIDSSSVCYSNDSVKDITNDVINSINKSFSDFKFPKELANIR